jgi:hypothetical protein
VQRRLTRMFLAVVVSVVATVSALTVASAPAQAAAGCYGDWCTGKDPSTTGTNNNPCQNGARTVSETVLRVWRVHPGTDNGYWAEVGKLQLRWSDRCKTNWARLELSGSARLNRLHIDQAGTTVGYYHRTAGWDDETTSPGIFWTAMIYSPHAQCRAYVKGGAFQKDTTDWR